MWVVPKEGMQTHLQVVGAEYLADDSCLLTAARFHNGRGRAGDRVVRNSLVLGGYPQRARCLAISWWEVSSPRHG